MLWRTVLRSSSATWLAPLLAVFVVVVLQQDLIAGVTAGYWTSALGGAGFALPFVAPACAAAGAWEGARLVRGRADRWAPARSGLGVAFPMLLPVLALGIFGMAVAAYLTISTAQPTVGVPPFGIVAMWLVVLVAHGMVGFLIGKHLPLVLAAPLALVLSFVITAYPAAFEPLWLRHLVTGGVSTCCALDQALDWRGVGSATAVAFGVVVAATLMMTALSRTPRVLAALGALAAGLTSGVWLAHGLPAEPAVARPGTELRCEGGDPRICVWPEVSDDLKMIKSNASDARLRLLHAGLRLPTTLTMSENPRPDELYIGAWPQPSPADVRSGVAGALMPSEPPACSLSGRPFPGGEAYGSVGSWLALTAGTDPGAVADRYGAKELAVATHVTEWPLARQKAWFRHNSKSLRDCTTKPALTQDALRASAAGAGR